MSAADKKTSKREQITSWLVGLVGWCYNMMIFHELQEGSLYSLPGGWSMLHMFVRVTKGWLSSSVLWQSSHSFRDHNLSSLFQVYWLYTFNYGEAAISRSSTVAGGWDGLVGVSRTCLQPSPRGLTRFFILCFTSKLKFWRVMCFGTVPRRGYLLEVGDGF